MRIGVALAGGGPLGAIYEIGALAALTEALAGINFNEADVYVGVSAGGFIAAGLANGITPHQFSRLFIEGDHSVDHFDPTMLLRPALGEYARRIASLPPLMAGAALEWLVGGRGLMSSFERLGRAIPTGLFSGAEVDRYLSRVFDQPGRTNDFHKLAHKLYLVATNLDTGASVTFGAPGHTAVPISRAVQATAALPGLFPPVEIHGSHYVDGALRKTLHASVALAEDLDLLICLNPLVPYDASPEAHGHRAHAQGMRQLVDGGLPVVLAQTFRSIIHSRLGAGMERYRSAYPHTDILLLEPSRADAAMFFTNLFSYSNRRRLCEHAYQKTRHDLWVRRHELAPLLHRHGIELMADILADRSMTLIKSPHRHRSEWFESPASDTAVALEHTLDDLERWLRLTHPAFSA
ncbi:MAG: patatin-like phospholipase family protein [Burkholderiaceae bacterium]